MSSKERQTADAIVAAFNAMDIDKIISLRTPDCVRVFKPDALGFKSQSNDQYRASLLAIMDIFSSFKITVTDVIEGTSEFLAPPDEQGNGEFTEKKKIVIYVNALGDTPIGEYKNQYVWKMGFDKSGEKVNEWEEYVDAGMARDFFPRLQAEIARRMLAAEESEESPAK